MREEKLLVGQKERLHHLLARYLLVEKQNVQNAFLFSAAKSKNRTSISDESTGTDILRHPGSLRESGGKAREGKSKQPVLRRGANKNKHKKRTQTNIQEGVNGPS